VPLLRESGFFCCRFRSGTSVTVISYEGFDGGSTRSDRAVGVFLLLVFSVSLAGTPSTCWLFVVLPR
jgi:hypothetical protein